MTLHLARIAAAVAVAGSASACDKILGSSAPAAPAAANYELVSLSGSTSVTGGFIRINTTNGQTVVGYDNQTTLITVADTPAPPAGLYHVYAWSTIMQPGGAMTWNAIRMDAVTGRLWRLAGDGNATPFSWSEQSPPSKL
jgi:hypothetical protein